MPRNKGQSPRAVSSGPNWYGFIRCEFDAESKERFNIWFGDLKFDAVWEWITTSVEQFKLTFSWADKQNCFQASMTGSSEDEKMYFGWTLTARGRDLERTMAALMFKHEIILQRKWTKNVDGEVKDGDWVG